MSRYVFAHHDLDVFVIKAKNKRAAIDQFIRKVRGRFGFYKDAKKRDFLDDISQMNIVITKATEIR